MKYQYARLCLILVLSLLLGLPLRESGYGVGVIGVLSIAGIYTAACAAGSTRSRRRVYLVAILPTVLITLKIALFGAAAGLALAGTALVLGFLAFAAVAILLRLAQQDRVTADTVLGGICVYLLIGFVFFYLFDMVELIHPGAFLERDQRLRPPVNAEHLLIRRPELNYFSFVTLTCLSDHYATAASVWSSISMHSGEGASTPEALKTRCCHIWSRNAPSMSLNVGLTL
jgi:hypothetical protein